MARKDLTALAALGTLGYMLSKKGDKKDEKQTAAAAERRIAADKEASAEPQSMEDDSGMDPMEAANKRIERTLTPNERGAAGTSETVTPSPKPIMRKPVVKSRPMSPAMDASMQETNASPTTRAEYDMGISNVPRRNSYYKKGGPVKKMASGGMTSKVSSASKRADGIATKGKTRGRMV